MAVTSLTLDQLWRDAPAATGRFEPRQIAHLPEPVRRYLTHAIAPGAPLSSAVRLQMSGEIKLKRWLPFTAEQVLRWDRGLIWQARVKMGRLTVSGSDRFIDGQGAMRWKLLGLLPVMRAQGPDIARSAAGRLQTEAIWVPAVLLRPEVQWTAVDETHLRAAFEVMGHATQLALTIDGAGRLTEVALHRWGNPEGGAFSLQRFGGLCLAERSFAGTTIPSELRVGWQFGSPRFEEQGEFWRATLAAATYR